MTRPMQLMRSERGDAAELYIYGDIYEGSHVWNMLGFEDGTDSVELVQALNDLPDDVTSVDVHINSYGGDCSEGIAIHNALKGCGRRVTTYVDGFACSIASVVFMAGSERVMGPASMLMVHDPWMGVTGNADELRHAAEGLDAIGAASRAAYLDGTDVDAGWLDSAMRAETWLTAEDALDAGLCTRVEGAGAERPAACARVSERVAEALREGPVAHVDLRLSDEQVDRIAGRALELLAGAGDDAPEDAEPGPAWKVAPLGAPADPATAEDARDDAPPTGYRRLAAALNRD